MPSLPVSATQVRKLGDRLRDADVPAEEDLRLLEQVLAVYGEALESVRLRLVRLDFNPTIRLKTTGTVVDKLRRERGEGYSLRLTSIQDLAGARVVVHGSLDDQDAAVARIVEEFAEERTARITDRRAEPSFGYRAVHVIVTVQGLAVEVQVRTELQDLWAQTFERLADAYGRGIRYGEEPLPDPGGNEQREERRRLVTRMFELGDDIAFIEAEKNRLDGRKLKMQQLGAGVVESIEVTREYEASIRRLLELVARAVGRKEAS